VFEAPPSNENEEPGDLAHLERRERIGRYLSWHFRRQLSMGAHNTRRSFPVLYKVDNRKRYMVARMGRIPRRHH